MFASLSRHAVSYLSYCMRELIWRFFHYIWYMYIYVYIVKLRTFRKIYYKYTNEKNIARVFVLLLSAAYYI